MDQSSIGRNRLLRCACVWIVAAIAGAIGLSAQTQTPRIAATSQQTLPEDGLILGQVIDAGTGQGVAGAVITLTGGSPTAATMRETQVSPAMAAGLAEGRGAPPTRRVISGPDGRFLFRELTRGSYAATATLAGYTVGAFGRRQPEGPGRALELADHEKRIDATIRLWRLAAISGTIVDEAGEPMVGLPLRVLRRTYVAGQPRLAVGVSTQTDDRGIYRFASLTPGDYVVTVPSTSVTVSVASAEQYRSGASGGSEEMQKMLAARSESGAPMTTGAGMRVGEFQIQSSSLGRSMSVLAPGTDGRLLVYPTAFFPGVSSIAQATAVTVGSGEQRTGVDLMLRPVPGGRVSGTLVGPDGPMANNGLQLVAADAEFIVNDSGSPTATALSTPAGTFTFLGVPAGQYKLQAYRIPRPELTNPAAANIRIMGGMAVDQAGRPLTSPAPTTPSLFAEVPVNVGDAPIEGITVVLRPGPRVSGRIEFEGATPPPTPQRLLTMTISLGGVDSRLAVSSTPARPDPTTGRFSTPGVAPGKYTINVSPPGPEWTVKSMRGSGVNALEQPLQLTSDISDLVITFTDKPMELSGTVQGIKRDDDQAYRVLLFPANYQDWIAQGMFARRMTSTVASSTGAYQLRVPVAGDYLVVAAAQEVLTEARPELFAALARVATRVSIAEGEKKSQVISVSQVR